MVGVELSPVPVATVEDQFRPGSPDAMDLSLLTPIRLLGSLRRTPHRFIPANAKKEMARQVQPPCVFPFFERKRETIGQRRNERGGAIEGPDLFDFPASLFATFFQKRLGKMTHVLALTEIWDQLETVETPFDHRPQTAVVGRCQKKMAAGFGQFLEEGKNVDHLLVIKMFDDFD